MTLRRAPLLLAGALLLGACSAEAEPAASRPALSSPSSAGVRTEVPAGTAGTATPPPPTATPDLAPYVVSDGRPRDALLTISRLGIRGLRVETYRGQTDDVQGESIQDTGIVASPSGPRGGTGPGGVGNYQVTGHRTSADRIFEFLPDLRRGDRVSVAVGDRVYVYEVRRTRITSFRDPQSLREQRAAVPGRPGAVPRLAMITLSTCRTQEDHAEGNFWSDDLGNPEHRIDKIGVLVRTLTSVSHG